MVTNALPRSIRDQAYEVMAARLGRTPSCEDRLADLGGVVVVNLLIDLELEFGIGLDVDEVMPEGTIGVLAGLAEIRARSAGRQVDPAEACRIYDLAMERARRARPERPAMRSAPSEAAWRRTLRSQAAERRTRIVMLFIGTGCLAGFIAGLAMFAQINGWLA